MLMHKRCRSVRCCRSDVQFAVATSSPRRTTEVVFRTRPDTGRILKIRPGKTPNFRELGELRRNAVTFLQWMKVNNCKIDNCKQSTIKILSITHYHYSVMRVGLREETAISSSVSTGLNTTSILVEKGMQ